MCRRRWALGAGDGIVRNDTGRTAPVRRAIFDSSSIFEGVETMSAEHPQRPAATGIRLGAIRLAVRDLDRAVDFYTRAIGLRTLPADGAADARLGLDGRVIVEFDSAPDARPAARTTSGLFHLAVLVPDRAALASAVRRVTEAGHGFTGASDHLVSEALYLNDPEGNGIEIYRDRPAEQWPRRDGALQMDTLPLDINAVMAELPAGAGDPRLPEGTRLGHVHLKVDSLDAARRFYAGVIGLDVMVDTYPGALFVAADGYHHHVGLNTWMSRAPAEPGTLGLRHYEIVVPDAARRASIAQRAETAAGDGGMLTDPAGNRVVIAAG
jgi:catechol 2,3-dioxygenase